MKAQINSLFWIKAPHWILIGSVIILFPIIAVMTVENIRRQNEKAIHLMLEKGGALIRSFEAGARSGMGMFRETFKLQQLLTETAQQRDIVYLMVTDPTGKIIAHNDPNQRGKFHGTDLNSNEILQSQTDQWRIVQDAKGNKIFEIFRRFSPSCPFQGGRFYTPRRGPRALLHPSFEPLTSDRQPSGHETLPLQIIFIGLDMKDIEDAQKADRQHTIVMGIILLLMGFAGITLLFMAHAHRLTKESLSRIKAFSDTLVENMPIGLVVLDSRKQIASFNQVADGMFHLSSAEPTGQNSREFLPQALLELIENPKIQSAPVEKELDCPVGSAVIPMDVIASMLKDETGSELGYVLLFKDLSEVRSLRQEVARSQRLASIGRLAAGVAHEIRNPLSSIKGFATYFKERYRNIKEDQEIAGILIQETDRLNRVVGQLLEFARPVSISKQAVPIENFIRNSLRLVEKQTAEKRITVHTDLNGIQTVFMDADRMNQVMLNLYLNAIEAMEIGGTLSVSVLKSEGGGIEMRVADTGCGIRKEDLNQVFDPYFTTKPAGTGLGLAIVSNIIEAHDATIRIDSQIGKGTTIRLILPSQTV